MNNNRSQPASKGKRNKPASAKNKPTHSGAKRAKNSPPKSPAQSKRKQTVAARKKQPDPAAKFMKEYLKQLRAVRKGSLPTRAELEQGVQKWEHECAGLKAEVKKAEALAKKRKREIDEWKQWYNGIPKIDKSEEWAKLEAEIAWRAHEINDAQNKINQLYEQHLAAQTQLEMARHWLIAYDHGILEKPLKEDPRYVALMAAPKTATKKT
jgi:hypothetical protein